MLQGKGKWEEGTEKENKPEEIIPFLDRKIPERQY